MSYNYPPSHTSAYTAKSNKGYMQTGKGQLATNETCGNCNRHGHTVRECVGPVDNLGCIKACPVCNSNTHVYAFCELARFSPSEINFHFVTLRDGKPPLALEFDVRTLTAWGVEGRCWTQQTALENAQQDPDYWCHYVYHANWRHNLLAQDATWDDGSIVPRQGNMEYGNPGRHLGPRGLQRHGIGNGNGPSGRDESKDSGHRYDRRRSRSPEQNRQRYRSRSPMRDSQPSATPRPLRQTHGQGALMHASPTLQPLPKSHGQGTPMYASPSHQPLRQNQGQGTLTYANPTDKPLIGYQGQGHNRQRTADIDPGATVHGDRGQGNPAAIAISASKIRLRCTNCGELDHLTANCPFTCGKCNKGGHFASECFKRGICKCKEFPRHVTKDCDVVCPHPLCNRSRTEKHMAVECKRRCAMCGLVDNHAAWQCKITICGCGEYHFGATHDKPGGAVACMVKNCERWFCKVHCQLCGLNGHEQKDCHATNITEFGASKERTIRWAQQH